MPLEFSASFAARCRSAFFASPVPAPSSLELSVQAALASIGLRTQQKVRTALAASTLASSTLTAATLAASNRCGQPRAT